MEAISALLGLESIGHRGIPLTKEFLYFLWYAPDQTVEQTVDALVIWDAIVSIMTPL